MIIFKTLDIIFFCIFALMVGYILLLGIASFFRNKKTPKPTSRQNRFVILFPAYSEDKVIINSVKSFLLQDYPKELYHVVVISDHMADETNTTLHKLPIEVLIATYENSTKAKALNLAVDHLKDKVYDVLVIMDADNVVDYNFLTELNKAYASGNKAIQAHRVAKNTNTDVALLDAVSEEINNAIFRQGHVNLGLSSSLIGSGMAFDYKWFKDNVHYLQTSGEDRELEVLLLKNRIHVCYLPNVKIYDEKTQNIQGFKNQRKRWQAVQADSLSVTIWDLPKAILQGNWDYCNKIIHWMIPPRSIMLVVLPFISLVITLFDWSLSLKWWVITWLFYAIIIAVIPSYLCNTKLLKALFQIPSMAFAMCMNYLKLKEGKETFIHTEHDA